MLEQAELVFGEPLVSSRIQAHCPPILEASPSTQRIHTGRRGWIVSDGLDRMPTDTLFSSLAALGLFGSGLWSETLPRANGRL